MTFTELWNARLAKNPNLADELLRIEMTVAQFRALVEEAYRIGHEHGERQARASSIFDGLFGGR